MKITLGSATFLFLSFAQFVCLVHGSICLVCPRVSQPHQCTTFAEIWSYERCSTHLFLIQNDSTVYEFGYQSAIDCPSDDQHQADTIVRQRRNSGTDITLCRECCTGDLCNRKICGIRVRNDTNLACLIGDEASRLPSRSITYCNNNEHCYAAIRGTRPNQQGLRYGSYGCASQARCDRIESGLPDSEESCQRCCSQDGCNAYICHSQVQDSTTTTSPVQVSTFMTSRVQDNTSTVMHTTQHPNRFSDCWDLQNRGGYTQTAVYDIYPPPTYSRLRVRCDMTTDGGGWTVLQRRYDGSLNFTRSFTEYEEGFGDVSGEYWVGLWWIHFLTSQDAVQMRVDLCRVDDRAGYAVYGGFNVSGPGDTYTLHVGTYKNGSLGDYLSSYHDGSVFRVSGSCADQFRGGWWYVTGGCFTANLNGGRNTGSSWHSIAWFYFGGHGSYPNVRSSEMKIRPRNSPGDPTHPYTCPS